MTIEGKITIAKRLANECKKLSLSHYEYDVVTSYDHDDIDKTEKDVETDIGVMRVVLNRNDVEYSHLMCYWTSEVI